ncbi:hypothetical protein [Actomonas aquatica]|uniref:Uncharacterized protein n=1 Tax=Actomonas aquatica TaxID=2866162 RepID=A0ABZ1C2I4_9BACT|nr:hypothetical protein [Opitutus sp. WL0086]WRQ85795.1 hypothetical protein K1X11_013365 [Opitutus sp. WL0086]
MTTSSSLESGLFASFWDDGLLDLLLGCAVLTTGLGWVAWGPLAILHVPIWITLWAPLRRTFVEPHAGYVRFSQSRRERNAHYLAFSLTLGIGALALMGLAALRLAAGPTAPTVSGPLWIAGLPAFLIALGILGGSLLTHSRRLLLYTLWLTLCAIGVALLRGEPSISLLVGGGGLLLGAILQWRHFRHASREFEQTSSS